MTIVIKQDCILFDVLSPVKLKKYAITSTLVELIIIVYSFKIYNGIFIMCAHVWVHGI